MMKKSILFIGLFIGGIFLNAGLQAQGSHTGPFKFISPVPGAEYANPEHTITLRHDELLDAATLDAGLIRVTGSMSGLHAGGLTLAADGRTMIFTPAAPFMYNEAVTVEIGEGIATQSGAAVSPFSYSFRTMQEDNAILKEKFIGWMDAQYLSAAPKGLPPAEKPAGIKTTMALPDDYPAYEVTLINNPAPGYMFVTPHNAFHPLNAPSYSVIMDHYGTPVYYNRCETHSLDLKIQRTGVISQFLVTSAGGLGIGYGAFYTYDNGMNPLDTFQMGNGYVAEMHDFQLFDDGSYLLFTYDPQIVDMSQIVEGGDPAATVMGFVLQELDANDNVVFEWSSWDHLSITDATPDIDLTGVFIDYCHGNAVERDYDGNLMVSFRNTDEIIKINRETGDIMWRLNAFRDDLNDFEFVNDTIRFSHQHDIRRLDNGNITLFDNGNLHFQPYSRLIEYALDEENMIAELVWVYPPEPAPDNHFGFATGNAQWLPGGNVVAGWGIMFPIVPDALIFGEVTPGHQTSFQVWGHDTITTYRAHKHEWETDLFSLSKDTVNWGEFTGYTPEPYIIQVTNNSMETMVISGVHNRTEEFYPATSFPLTIDPGATGNITVNFFPSTDGYFQDVMTIMCAKGEYEMIGKQVVLMGYTEDEAAPDVAFDPADGSEEIVRMPTLKMTFDEKLFKTNGEMITNEDLDDLIYLALTEGSNIPIGGAVPVKAWISWYDNEKTEIMVQPFDYLDANTLYYWGVKANTAQDWAGNAIGEGTYATFTTSEEMGVDDILVDDFARVYPNPGNGIIHLEFVNNDPKSVRIFNIDGREIVNADHLNGMSYTFDITDQPEGLYIVQVVNISAGTSVELKVIKK